MAGRDPFAVLGLAPGASLEQVRAARRRLAKEAHPDHGGDEARMREINAAFDAAVKAVLRPPPASASATPSPPSKHPPPPPRPPRRRPPAAPQSGPRRIRVVEQDIASFVIPMVPSDAFAVLDLATRALGDAIDHEPSHWMEAHLYEPGECWCRLDLLPEGGSTQVAVTIAHVEGTPWPPPDVDAVRDVWIDALSHLST